MDAAPRGTTKKKRVYRAINKRKPNQKEKVNASSNHASNAGSANTPKSANGSQQASQQVQTNVGLVQRLVQSIQLDDAKAFQELLNKFVGVAQVNRVNDWQLDLNVPTPKGEFVLVEACRFDRVHMLRQLLGQSASNDGNSNDQPQAKAAGNGHKLMLNPNVASRRRNMTPVMAACMTLDETLVKLLLQHFDSTNDHKPPENRTIDFSHALSGSGLTPLMVLVGFTICNGHSTEQAHKANGILRHVLKYLHKHGKLQQVLAQKDKKTKHNVVQLAASTANWQALAMFREFNVDLTELGTAGGHILVETVEINSFNNRKFVARDFTKKKVKPTRGGPDAAELKGAADKKMDSFSPLKSLQRAIEGFHLTQTLLEIAKDTGIPSLFVSQENGIRSFYLKSYVIANAGLVPLTNHIASSPQATMEQKEAFFTMVGTLFYGAIKDRKVLADLWTQALKKTPAFPLKGSGGKSSAYQGARDGPGAATSEKSRRGSNRGRRSQRGKKSLSEQQDEQQPQPDESIAEAKEQDKDSASNQLTPEAFQMIMNSLLSTATLPRCVKTWKMIVIELYELYSRDKSQPFSSASQIVNVEFYSLAFYRRIIQHIYRIACRMIFDVYCRPGHNYEDIDEEQEFRVLLASVEMFVQFFVIHARVLMMEQPHGLSSTSLIELIEDLVAPLDKLWSLLEEALVCVDGSMEVPSRFSLVLFVLQVFDQIRTKCQDLQSPANDVSARELMQLYQLVANFMRNESLRRITDLRPASDLQMLRTVANALMPLSKQFVSRVQKLKGPIHKLVESDPKILGLELASLTSIQDFFLLEHKVDYLSTVAAEKSHNFHLSVARMTSANCLEFVLLQVMCASVQGIRGELDITLVHEPAVGSGVVREFFQLLSESFFNPEYVLPHEECEEVKKPHVNQIGIQWLQLVRQAPHFLHDQERFVREVTRQQILEQAKEDFERQEFQHMTGEDEEDRDEEEIEVHETAGEAFQSIADQVHSEMDAETRTARLLKCIPQTKVLSYKEQLCRMWPLFEYINAKDSRELRVARRKPVVKRTVYDSHLERTTRDDGDACGSDDHQHVVLSQQDFDEPTHEKQKILNELYRAIGRILGLAIRYEQPLGAYFPLAFWKFVLEEDASESKSFKAKAGKKKFKGKPQAKNRVTSAGTELYNNWEEYCDTNDVFKRSLQFVLDHDFDNEPLDMRFEYTTDVEITDDGTKPTASSTSVAVEVLLSEELGNVAVTNDNKHEYVYLRALKSFFGEEKMLYDSLRLGICDVITKQDLQLFSAQELQRVVRGNQHINVELLKKTVEYTPSGITANHPVVQEFWRVVETFDHQVMEKLLLFWSGSSIPPLFGFDSKYSSTTNVQNGWTIEIDTSAMNKCPEANTCDRCLVLPRYEPLSLLKDKLMISLVFGATGYDRL